MSKLEGPPFESSLFPEKYEAAFLLGGYGAFNSVSNKIELNNSADRLIESLALYHSKKIEKIIILSGAASEEYPEFNEAMITRDLLERSGVKNKDILIEDQSLNTFQNAQNAKLIIEKENLKGPFLLITSAYHMRRAKDCFDTQNIQTVSYPVDYQSTEENWSVSYLLIPNVGVLDDWKIIIKELIGYIVYDVRGYID